MRELLKNLTEAQLKMPELDLVQFEYIYICQGIWHSSCHNKVVCTMDKSEMIIDNFRD